MNKQHILDTYVKLGCTKYGVGVVALKPIPKRTYIFKTPKSLCDEDKWIQLTEKEIKKFPLAIQKLVYDFGAVSGGPLVSKGPAVVPINGFASMNMSNYMNHSIKPNCEPVFLNKCLMTFRTIRKNEMLTYNYGK